MCVYMWMYVCEDEGGKEESNRIERETEIESEKEKHDSEKDLKGNFLINLLV